MFGPGPVNKNFNPVCNAASMLEDSMDLARAPSVTRRVGETLYRWGNTLGVVVLASGEVGQFTTSIRWTRPQVESFLASKGLA